MGQRKSNLLTYGRRLRDIGRVMVEAVYNAGGNDEDAERIFTIHRQLAQLIMGKLKFVGHPSSTLASSYGYTVLEDVTPSEFKVVDLELVPFLNPEDGGRIGGETLRQRAVTLKANLGLVNAKYILDHQSEIPTEFRDYVLVFTGTLLRVSGGGLHVACLCWYGGCWHLDFDWLDCGFSGVGRLVRCKS